MLGYVHTKTNLPLHTHHRKDSSQSKLTPDCCLLVPGDTTSSTPATSPSNNCSWLLPFTYAVINVLPGRAGRAKQGRETSDWKKLKNWNQSKGSKVISEWCGKNGPMIWSNSGEESKPPPPFSISSHLWRDGAQQLWLVGWLGLLSQTLDRGSLNPAAEDCHGKISSFWWFNRISIPTGHWRSLGSIHCQEPTPNCPQVFSPQLRITVSGVPEGLQTNMFFIKPQPLS